MSELPRIVVTGVGPVSAAGTGRERVWKTIEAGEARVRSLDFKVEGEAPWGPFAFYPPEAAEVNPADNEALPPDSELRLSVAALRLAVRDAGLGPEALRGAGLVLTYEAPGIERLLSSLLEDFLDSRKRPDPPPGASRSGDPGSPRSLPGLLETAYRRHRDAVYHTHSFMHLHLAARALGVHGPTLFLNNACASGLYALEAAADQLRMGRCKLALAAAAESPHFPTKYLWFREAGVYSPSGRLRPFDRDRDGLVLGAGSAAVALETLEAAEARGAPILAEYLGGASSQEGWKVAVPNLTERFYEETLRAALRAARVEPDEIDLLNPHGAGTPLGDRAEAMGIAAVFGPWPARPRVTCFKPCLGHTLGASALLETVALLLCMEHGVAPATPGFEREDPALRVRCLARSERAELRTVLKMSCGFAGFNAGAVFRRY